MGPGVRRTRGKPGDVPRRGGAGPGADRPGDPQRGRPRGPGAEAGYAACALRRHPPRVRHGAGDDRRARVRRAELHRRDAAEDHARRERPSRRSTSTSGSRSTAGSTRRRRSAAPRPAPTCSSRAPRSSTPLTRRPPDARSRLRRHSLQHRRRHEPRPRRRRRRRHRAVHRDQPAARGLRRASSPTTARSPSSWPHEHMPDLVLLDVMMPKVDGVELCRRLRANPFTANLPVIMLTAKSLSADKVVGLTAGADDYIIKPFDTLELVARVRSTLRRNAEMRATSPLTGLPGNHRIEEEIAERGVVAAPPSPSATSTSTTSRRSTTATGSCAATTSSPCSRRRCAGRRARPASRRRSSATSAATTSSRLHPRAGRAARAQVLETFDAAAPAARPRGRAARVRRDPRPAGHRPPVPARLGVDRHRR